MPEVQAGSPNDAYNLTTSARLQTSCATESQMRDLVVTSYTASRWNQ